MVKYNYYIDVSTLSCPWQTHVLKKILPILKTSKKQSDTIVVAAAEFDVDIKAIFLTTRDMYVKKKKKKKHLLEYFIAKK